MSLQQFRLDGKSALITGGNREIGFAIAKVFIEAGANCVLSSRSNTAQMQDLIAVNPGHVAWVQADVIAENMPEKIVSTTLERFGRLDILVNNAGIADHGDFHEFSDTRLASIIDTNFTAPFRIAREAINPERNVRKQIATTKSDARILQGQKGSRHEFSPNKEG